MSIRSGCVGRGDLVKVGTVLVSVGTVALISGMSSAVSGYLRADVHCYEDKIEEVSPHHAMRSIQIPLR